MTTSVHIDPRTWWAAQGWAADDVSVHSTLPHLGVIAAQGPDAATFLHGQLSQDILHLGHNEARLAAYCTAKGRMLASFVVLHPAPDTFWLVVNQAVLPAVLKRLSMFVLRAKVKLSDASASLRLVGELKLAPTADAPAADQPMPVTVQAADADGATPSARASLRDVQGISRVLSISPGDATEPQPAVLSAWRWLEVMAGVPQIEPATSEQFVPQMVNFELIGGVNFKKGCYPGQEVVARSQYRGTTKRRAFVLAADTEVLPGAELFSSTDPGQPAGMVINAAPFPAGTPGHAVLAEVKLQAVDALQGGATLHVGAATGAPLSLLPQPYPIPREEAA